MQTKRLMFIVVVVLLLAYSGMYIFGDTLREMMNFCSDKQQNNMTDNVLVSSTTADKDIVLSSSTTAQKSVILSKLYRGHGNYKLRSPNARSWSQSGQERTMGNLCPTHFFWRNNITGLDC